MAVKSLEMMSVTRLDTYQSIQFDHDRTYHPDILSLGVLGRMQHIVFHLVKYRAKLSSLESDNLMKKMALVDTFIMLVSACNTLSLRVSESVDLSPRCSDNREDYLECYIQFIGNLAKACESGDHQEDYPINTELKKNIISLLIETIFEANKKNINIIDASQERLDQVEKNNNLYFILKDVK